MDALFASLQRNVLRSPWKTFIVDDQRRWRGIELWMASRELARHIAAGSDRPRIGFMLPTSGLAALTILGIRRLQRTIVPVNYLLPRAERDAVIGHAELDAIVTVTPMIARFGELPAGVRPLLLDQMPLGRLSLGLPPGARVPSAARTSALRAHPDDDLAALLYTSGTSGGPKGVMLSEANLESNIRQCIAWASLGPEAVFLGVLPSFHCFGFTVLTLLPLYLGAKVVYTARFMPGRVLELLREHRPRVMLAVPSMLGALLRHDQARPEDLASVKYLVSGGEPLSQDIFDGYRERFGVTLNEGYGLTETSPVDNWCRPEDHKRGSVGPPLPGIEEKIVSADGMRLGPGEEGEIRIKGPNVMRGYYKDDAQTAAAFDEEGFFRTGDIGHLDADGHLFITGRLKEMIIIGGENVFPRVIEEVLNAHPQVAASAVIGISDARRGEMVLAFVEPVTGAAIDPNALRAWCRDRLAPYQVPRRVQVIAELPRSPSGKILKRELRNLADDAVQ